MKGLELTKEFAAGVQKKTLNAHRECIKLEPIPEPAEPSTRFIVNEDGMATDLQTDQTQEEIEQVDTDGFEAADVPPSQTEEEEPDLDELAESLITDDEEEE